VFRSRDLFLLKLTSDLFQPGNLSRRPLIKTFYYFSGPVQFLNRRNHRSNASFSHKKLNICSANYEGRSQKTEGKFAQGIFTDLLFHLIII
jgi:hypothetical protein